MMKWFAKRSREPSSWGGLAAALIGISTIADFDEGKTAGEVVAGVGQQIAAGADSATAVVGGLAAVLAIVLSERGKD